ncbi:ead/Ea22-like family protein [Salmonella enterica]|nr:ead/Ea22-like family protein [Salmonella enterica]EHA0879753.1 ead/Ea22-like family protein [Salmonella enterica]EKP2011877.1 ead/Ea22-like family protein [Salmonella enterica]EKP2025203.1 ead/Ea22-like family protein [Salmonella enterica]EKP2052991.1 ead/Ea22-like family protein [Salmonella enterica]
MSNIDKQALREVAEKVNSGEWSYEEFNRMDLPGGAHININGRDAIYCLKKPVGGVEQSRAVTAFIAAFNPKVALALLDEVEAAEHTAAVDHEAACSLVEENEELKRRITEMESKNGNLRTIAHDQNELTIKANLDSINDAVEMDRLHKRIAELEAREISLPECSSMLYRTDFHEDYHTVMAYKVSDVIAAIRAAGIKVKGE